MREATYSSFRMGMYDPIKFGVSQFYATTLYSSDGKKSQDEVIKEVGNSPFVKWGS